MSHYLPIGYKIKDRNRMCEYTVKGILGRGASTIAYLTDFLDDSGCSSERILKEYCPSAITITREDNGALLCDESCFSKYQEGLVRFRNSGSLQNNLRQRTCLKNETPPLQRIFEANNTCYLDVVPFAGRTLDKMESLTLLERMKICLTVAKVIEQYHENGLLYLDLKPENIFVLTNAAGEAVTDLVVLIDFDSVIEKDKVTFGKSLSFTKSWAAPEQINPHGFQKISEATDVYALGELVFWCVFGRHSKDEEHRSFSTYAFDDAINYQAQRKLTEFFHNTLRSSPYNRWKTIGLGVDLLQDVVQSLTDKEYLVCRSIARDEVFVGRDEQVIEISDALEKNKTVYVCGMGGIGKTTLVRNYCAGIENQYDAILYLHYTESLIATVTDDNQLQINTVAQDDSESPREYFERKLRRLNHLYANARLLIVLDNYEGEFDADLQRLTEGNWETIVVTRKIPAFNMAPIIQVEAIADPHALCRLFEANLGRKVSADEYGYLDTIFEQVAYHTLVIQLIARQVKCSRLTLEKAVELVRKHGFARMAVEKVDIVKDQSEIYAAISDIITALFDASQLSQPQILTLKLLSLFDCVGVSEDIVQELLRLKSKDVFNELNREGWLVLEKQNISLHPVVSETVRLWAWTDALQSMLLEALKKLFKYLKLEGEREEYPKKLSRLNVKLKEAYENNPYLLRLAKKVFVRNDYVREVALERIMRGESYEPAEHEQLQKRVDASVALLNGCKSLKNVRESAIYRDLLYQTIIVAPRYKEEYILEKSLELLSDKRGMGGIAVLKLYSIVVSVYCERRDFVEAWATIGRAERFVKHQRDKHIHALYYDLISTYYNEKLDGAYDVVSDEEEDMLSLLLDALEQSIRSMKKSNHFDKELWLSRFLLSKANVLIRSYPEKKDEIDGILITIKQLLEENTLPYSQLRCDYNMSRAWYYTLVEPSYKGMYEFAGEAYKIGKDTFKTGLDFIDVYIVPVANMLLEWNLYEESVKWLLIAVQVCEKEPYVIPYIRKQMDLLSYMLDVYLKADDREKCRDLVKQIDAMNDQNTEYGVCVEISNEIRDALQ